MTDCSSIQGSTTSSSSDVTTLTTASSWCSISPSSRIRVLRLVRPHPRRILVTPNNSPSYGFSMRGGKEFGTGFFVSNIERYSEADHKGLKTGDQIIRVNGYRVEDAVHKELVQFISSQDRLTLKVRGVGVLPMKEKENDPLTWHVVRTATSSIACSEDSIKSVLSHRNRSKDVRVVLNVAPRTKLGLGICKGPEWKPGIFVQFTKEKSVARESGLRPGDQILCVNSIDFSDVLFSEAVAVMKSSTKLDMVVRTAAGCDLFPGESSGYNSSASSVTGDQSPCWADVSSKRLTVVCEESPANCNDQLYADVKKNLRSSEQDKYSSSSSDTGTLKERNKTIIKLSENGTSINNTYIENVRVPTVEQNASAASNDQKTYAANDGIKPIPPPPPPFHSTPASSSASVEASQKLADICFVSRQSETKTVIVEVHRSDTNTKKPQQLRFVSPEQTNSEKASRIQSEQQGDVGGPKGETNQSGGNTLCSAIAEELRKRKEKQRNNDHLRNHISNNGQMSDPAVGHNESNLSTKIKSQRRLGHVANSNNSERNCDDQHSALMNEFKRAHQRMFKNGFHENDHKERQDVLKNTIVKDYKEDKPTVAQQPNSGENAKLSADFVDAKVTNVESSTEFNGNLTYQNLTVMAAKSPRYESQKPPTSPIPDYEQVLVQGTIPKQMQVYSNMHLRNDATTTGNRRTMRLGTVTIGEYNQHQQKDPVKFEFLDKKTLQDGNRVTITEDSSTLRLELQDTLSRSNLRKNTSFSLNEPNGSVEVYEHQSHCQLQNNNSNNNNNKECTNVEKLTRMLQCRQTPIDAHTRPTSIHVIRNQPVANQKVENYSNGILKNGSSSRSSRPSFSKSSEKSISFGN